MRTKLTIAALVMALAVLAGACVGAESRGSVERVGQVDFITSEMDPVINLGQLGNRIDLDADNDSSIRASADDVVDFEVGAEDVVQFNNASVVLHDADASDFDLVFDGNAQDYYLCLDDTADELVIGLGSTCGTTPAIQIDSSQVVTLSQDPVIGGATPQLTIGDAGAEDALLVYDGNAQDYYLCLDDTADELVAGLGSACGTTPAIQIDVNQDVTFAQRLVVNGVEAADSAATNETIEIAFTSPVDTTGTNTHNAFTVDLAIGNATGGTNNVRGIQIDAITDDPQVVETAINIDDEWDYAIDTNLPIVSSAMYWFDDFIGDAVLTPYTEASGTDAEAVQAIQEEQFGVYQLTSGDAGVNTAGDGEQISLSLEWQADQGALVFETRLHLDTDVATVELCVGLTDNVALELPFTNAADVITAVANDAVAFCYDTNATTDEWWFLGVAGTTAATGNAASGTAPTANVYQVLRIEVDDGGADCRFYIDGALVGTLTANCVTNTVALAPVIVISSAQTATSHVVDVDYILVAADRD